MPGTSTSASVTQQSDVLKNLGAVERRNMKTTPGKHLKSNYPNKIITPSGKSFASRNFNKIRASSPKLSTMVSQPLSKQSSTVVDVTSQNPISTSAFNQQEIPKQQQSCIACSSNDVINIKLKSCQNCHNIVIDELNYEKPLIDGNSGQTSTAPTNQNYYHQQLALISKKLRSMYKNRIHTSYTDDQSSQNSIVQPSNTHPTDTRTVVETKKNSSIKIGSDYHHNKHTDDRECSSNFNSKLPLKSNSNNLINKDILILRIEDVKVKSSENDKKTITATASTDADITIRQSHPTKKLKNNGDTRTESNKKPSIRKHVIKKKSEKSDVRFRKDIIKQSRQSDTISKSLDFIPPNFDIDAYNNSRSDSARVYSSRSVTNIPKMKVVNSDDYDDGQFESINSVELIFISDDYLNKAIKHDLKILKNRETGNMIDADKSILMKKKLKKLETTVSPSKLNRITNADSRKLFSASPIKYSLNRSSTNSNIKKKLIIISEDFKRKSLENSVVIVDDCHSSNNSELMEKRKIFQQTKLSRQQSSIDDVANQMVSHAFRSIEEPDEQCLESKEIKSPE